jgi:predicted methyltransferase
MNISPISSPASRAIALVLAAGLAACAAPSAPPAAAPLSSQQVAQIVGSADRSAADRTNDARRKPEQLLSFIGVRPGMVALDLSAGGGYTSELLARAAGPAGAVYGQSQPRPAPAPGAAPAAAPRTSAMSLAERDQKLRAANVPAARIVAVERSFNEPVPPELAEGKVDLATLMFNYHDLGHMGIDRARMNAAVFRALKRGGVYVIADHSGRPGTGISESSTLHRVEEAFVRREVEAAGFRFAGEGGFLRNPSDPRDKNTPEPPQPKDEFVLKFVKP